MDLQQTALELARLGLRGDTDSVRQYVLKILRKNPAETEGKFREGLARLVLQTSRGVRTRGTASRSSRPAVPVDSATYQPLARVVTEVDAPPPVLAPDVRREIEQVIAERRQSESLALAGLEPTRSLLLTGAPGTGKTMTAHYVAATLELPLVTIDLATVMSSFLGKTGQNLREALDYARNVPCVLLLDEFDALGKRRDDPTDVGELKRIVNVLLLELEHWPPQGLLIAATNHPELLDRAVWRRFDRVVVLGLPSHPERNTIIERAFTEHGQEVEARMVELLAQLTAGASGSELTRLIKEAVRERALGRDSNAANIVRDLVVTRLSQEARRDKDARVHYAIVAHNVLGHSTREIATLLGVSHVTVGKLLRANRVSVGDEIQHFAARAGSKTVRHKRHQLLRDGK